MHEDSILKPVGQEEEGLQFESPVKSFKEEEEEQSLKLDIK